MIFYIADTHFGHDNIRKLSHRPFNSIEEMDNAMIDNWNKRVTEDDDVYILGDFSYKGEDPIEYLKKLKGKKHLIVGNHDGRLLSNPEHKKHFIEVADMKMVDDNGTQIFLCHYPMVEWNGYYKGVLHFYGHVHNAYHNETVRYARDMKNAYNVGVDVIGFAPCTLNEITK